MGTEDLEGNLHYRSETGSRQLGDVDLGEYLDKRSDQQLMIVFVPTDKAEKETVTFGVCRFVMDEARERPRCKLMLQTMRLAVAHPPRMLPHRDRRMAYRTSSSPFLSPDNS
jgi:hypothetical protein